MALRNRTAERNRRIALKAWLKEQDAWDGKAYATDPETGELVDMDEYHRGAAYAMQQIDRMPAAYRQLVHEFRDFEGIWNAYQVRMPANEARDMLSR